MNITWNCGLLCCLKPVGSGGARNQARSSIAWIQAPISDICNVFFTGYSSKKLYCMDTIIQYKQQKWMQNPNKEYQKKQRDPGDPSKDLTGGGILGDG